MTTKTLSIALIGFLTIFQSYGQLPPEKELYDYTKNAFFRPNKSNTDNPFLIIVIPNKLKVFPYWLRNFPIKQLPDPMKRDRDSFFTKSRPYYFEADNFDSSKAIVLVQGINRKNVGKYEYRIMKNGQENNNWVQFNTFYPGTFTSGFGENDPEMAAIGYVGTSIGSYLTFDVRERTNKKIINGASVLWLNHRPKIIATFTPNEFNKFFQVFKLFSQVEKAVFTPIDSVSSLLNVKHEFTAVENNLIFYLSEEIKQKIIEYKVEQEGENNEWQVNDLDFNFIWLKDLKPGKYKLFIRYSIQRHNVTEFDFEIKPAWQQTVGFKIIAGSLVAAFLGFIIILIKTRGHQHKMLKKQLEKDRIEMELKAIRAQLNPHFVFNSLNSIQNLVNKSDISNANKYLSEFSKLMRDTLNTSDRKFNSIANEIKVLKTYLSLEQLRFNFKFSINTDVDAGATEIPSLLIQPLIENAVKHGIETLKENGVINVNFSRKENDLSITIFDNGKGFPAKVDNGYGLKMTEDRITLLNLTMQDQFIKLERDSATEGTTIHLLFKNWFL